MPINAQNGDCSNFTKSLSPSCQALVSDHFFYFCIISLKCSGVACRTTFFAKTAPVFGKLPRFFRSFRVSKNTWLMKLHELMSFRTNHPQIHNFSRSGASMKWNKIFVNWCRAGLFLHWGPFKTSENPKFGFQHFWCSAKFSHYVPLAAVSHCNFRKKN